MQNLTFGYSFNPYIDKVSSLASLQSVTFSEKFNQSMEKVSLPAGLQMFFSAATLTRACRRFVYKLACICLV